MQKIQWLEVLNLPPHGGETKWKIWDQIDLEWGKNLLLIWWNGTGKSTMLQILHESIERSRRVLNWENLQKESPLIMFANYFDGNSYILSGEPHESTQWMSEREIQEAYESDCIQAFESAIAGVYWWWIIDVFNEWLKASYKQAESCLRDFKEKTKDGASFDTWCNRGGSNAFYCSDLVYWFLEWAKLFAAKYGISIEIIFWNIIAITNQVHWNLSDVKNVYWYMEPKWEQSDEIVILDNSEPGSESLWERSRRIVQELRESNGSIIALLDEPTNGVDRKTRKEISEAILKMKASVQIIAASHEDCVIDGAKELGDWVVYDLDEK